MPDASQPTSPQRDASIRVIDLGRMPYAEAYALQVAHHEEVLAGRDAPADGRTQPGRVLLVEHDPPVITVSRRPGAEGHLLASASTLAAMGVQVEPTDRGGDITYHGPGQLVVYPILDLNALNLRLHDYMRLLEQTVIDTLANYGLTAARDASATGVWIGDRKICAMGVRIRRWVSMHGLALNVTTDLSHFDLIVPCGLADRGVTSLHALLGESCPTMERVKADLVEQLRGRLAEHRPMPAPGGL